MPDKIVLMVNIAVKNPSADGDGMVVLRGGISMPGWKRNFCTALLAAAALVSHAGDAKKDPPKPDAPKDAKDPASKDPKTMTLDELEAAQICPVTFKPSKLVYHVALGDKEYHFNTRAAAKEFEANPEKFGYKKK